MNMKELVEQIDAETARAFVVAARNVVDALLIETDRVQQASTPGGTDYNAAELPQSTPAGGWISHTELRTVSQRLAEAISAEKWLDGLLAALRMTNSLGAVL